MTAPATCRRLEVADSEGGSIAKPAGVVGDKLQLKPLRRVTDKTIHVIRIIRGKKQMLIALVNMLVEWYKKMPKQLIGIAHADDLPVAKKLKR